MALIKCSECGKEISDKANNCPNCGCPIDKIRDFSEDIEMSNISVNSKAVPRRKKRGRLIG